MVYVASHKRPCMLWWLTLKGESGGGSSTLTMASPKSILEVVQLMMSSAFSAFLEI